MKAKINKNLLLGNSRGKERIGFYWMSRYSETNESDKKGRWARICYYNGLRIANIAGYEVKNKQLIEGKICTPNIFFVDIFFPASSNEYYGKEACKTEAEAKKWTEEMFEAFKKHIE